MNQPPYTDRHGEHWVGSYDTDEEDAIRESAEKMRRLAGFLGSWGVTVSGPAVDKPVESVDDAGE